MNTNRIALFDGSEIAFGDGERKPPSEILLLRFGKNAFTKGEQKGEFDFSENDADAVISEFSVRGKDVVIDYEHQTLKGSQAPAAGWIESLSKSADGLVAKVKYWTEGAAKYLKGGEYRYISPTLVFSRRGKSVSSLHSVALTNHPALHSIPALVADDSAADEGSFRDKNNNKNKNKGERKMNEILMLLGLVALADNSEEEQINAVKDKVKELSGLKTEVDEFLKLHDTDSLDKVTGKIKTMVPVEEKQRLEGELKKRDAETAVKQAFSDGKLIEASKDWALKFAEKDLEGFNDWAKNAPKVVPDNKNTDQQENEKAEKKISDKEAEIFSTIGLSDEEIKKIEEAE
jgi:phage I-like protein